MKAMIFAAGLGTRLQPLTLTKPKALAEINGVTLLEITITKLVRSGFDDIVINVHHFPGQITDFLHEHKNFGANITISDESDILLDTGGGLKKASHFFNDGKPFLVHNVDIVSDIDLAELYSTHLKNNCMATLVCMQRESSRQFLIDANHEICGWQNSKTGEIKLSKSSLKELMPVSFCGIHVIDPKVLNKITKTGVFSIIDVYLDVAKNYSIKAMLYNNISWIDVGSPEKLKQAEAFFNKKYEQ